MSQPLLFTPTRSPRPQSAGLRVVRFADLRRVHQLLLGVIALQGLSLVAILWSLHR